MNYFEELLVHGVPDTVERTGFTFEDCFDEFVASTQKVWKHDRGSTVGASECFGCIRKTWFSKRGAEFGFAKDETYEESWGAMRRGDMIENHHVVPAIRSGLERRGLALIMEGDDQETIVDGCSSATLDGLVIDPTGAKLPKDFLAYYGIPEIDADSIVLEMKSIDPRIALVHEKPIHRGQSQMQMGLIHETTDYRPPMAVVLYVNASWVDDISPFVVPFEEETYRMGRERNEKVFEVDDPALFAPEGKLDGDCKYCKFTAACAAVAQARVPARAEPLKKKEIAEQDQEMVDRLTPLVLARDVHKKEVDTAARLLEEANEAIRQHLIESGKSRAVGDGWKVFYSYNAGANRLSPRLLEEAGLDPEDFKERSAGFEKLTVSIAKD